MQEKLTTKNDDKEKNLGIDVCYKIIFIKILKKSEKKFVIIKKKPKNSEENIMVR